MKWNFEQSVLRYRNEGKKERNQILMYSILYNIQTRKENLLKKITFDYYSINVYVFRHMEKFYVVSEAPKNECLRTNILRQVWGTRSKANLINLEKTLN